MFAQLSNPTFTPSIPYDILRVIFITACSVRFDDRRHLTKTTTSDPLTLGSVCRTWYNVAWTTPRLWSTIFLQLSSTHRTLKLKLLGLYLTNSRDHPLSVYFDVEDINHAWKLPLGQVWFALEMLIEHCERWECLNICMILEPEDEFRTLLGSVKGRLPLLRSLHLEPLGNRNDKRLLLGMDMFHIAPKLQTFSMMTGSTRHAIQLPWRQFIFLRVCLPRQGVIRVLRASSQNLVHCHFLNVYKQDIRFSSDLVALPHLTTLKITQTDFDNVTYVLDFLHCPGLRQLHLHCTTKNEFFSFMGPTPYEIAESNWPKVSSFLKRSGCPPLEVLELEAYSFTDTIMSILEELPTLQKLSLVEKKAHNTHFLSLTEKLGSDFDPRFNIKSETAFLPLLKELRYVSSHQWYGDVGRATLLLPMFLRMLHSRHYAPGLSRLEVFSVAMNFLYNDTGPAEVEVLNGYKGLIRDGMQILIKRTDTGMDVLGA